MAETEAEQYAADLDAEYLGLAQAYAIDDELTAGAEVFSLMRASPLEPSKYLSTYFATGDERQTEADSD